MNDMEFQNWIHSCPIEMIGHSYIGRYAWERKTLNEEFFGEWKDIYLIWHEKNYSF
jgi:hypothetical protein